MMKNCKERLGVILRPKAHRKTEGQAFLELTLLLPVIFVLLVGIIAIGIALSYKMKVEAVAREATRVVAKNIGNGSVQIGLGRSQMVAQQYGFDLNKLEIEIRGAEDFATPARGGRVSATVTYHYKIFNLSEIKIVGSHSEVIECWRKRDDERSGGSCVPADEQ